MRTRRGAQGSAHDTEGVKGRAISTFRSDSRPDHEGYWIDGTRIFWEIDDSTVSLDYSEWEAIVAAYSREGRNLTKNECALEFDIPRTTLERMFKLAGIFKTSPPFTPERMAEVGSEEDLDSLVEASLELKQHRYFAKLQRAEIQALRKEVDELRAYKHDQDRRREIFIDAVREGLPEWKAPKKRVRIRGSQIVSPSERWSLHAPMSDVHFGKHAWGEEDFGQDYDIHIAYERVCKHGEWVAELIAKRGGRCRAYLADLGDYIHSLRGTTDSGTDLARDSRDKKVYRYGVAARREQIERVRKVAEEVIVLGVDGNHVAFADFAVTDALWMHYHDAPDVEVRTTFQRQHHFLEGDSLHLLDHGKGVGKLTAWKAQAQMDVVAREVAGEDFHRSQRIYYLVGHLHELQVGSLGKHAELMRLPSFSESEDYESGLRYAGNPVAHAFSLDERGRIAQTHRLYFND